MKHSTSIGIDTHAKTNSVCALDRYTGEIVETTLPSDPDSLIDWILSQGFKEPIKCCYESGPTGFGLAKALNDQGIKCVVVATSKLPKRIDMQKNDRIDARWLASFLGTGSVREVYIPSERQEALRHLSHLRTETSKSLRAAKQRVASFLLLTRTDYTLTKRRWTKKFWQWAQTYEFPLEQDTYVFRKKLREVDFLEGELADIDARIRGCIEEDEHMSCLSDAFCAVYGIGSVTAFSLVAEIYDFDRFRKGSQLASYLGLVPSERSTGNKTARGAIAKRGNANLRCLLVEAINIYFKPCRDIYRGSTSLPDNVRAKANKCTSRLYARKRDLERKGLDKPKIKIALARELAEWIYWIAKEVA